MNKILHLLDENYVFDLFKDRVLPHYPDFVTIKKIKIHAVKDYIWRDTYHVVIKYDTSFISRNGKIKKLPIYCTAHSDEPRKNAYDAMRYLWDNGFGRGYLSMPHPLFYSDRFQATFYRGAKGNNLYQYIRNGNLDEVESIVIKTARWFAKLHKLPVKNVRNFNQINSRIETVLPGISHILWRFKEDYPQYHEPIKKIYSILNEKEKRFFNSTGQRWLIHGDAHPENIIRMSPRKIAIIDFTDMCLSDFARDIGSFLQQLEYMSIRKLGDSAYRSKWKDLFLDNYYAHFGIKPDDYLNERIANYYTWTTLRTATYFLIKDRPEPKRAEPLIREVCEKFGLDIK